MHRLINISLLLTMLVTGFTAGQGIAQSATALVSATQGQHSIWLLTIDDAIGPAISDYVVRHIDQAHQENVELIILQMDTPGGLDSSMREIIQAILASKIPVATYVYPGGARAASAGTYILYASHVAAMAPATNLGAATPVQIGMPSLPQGDPDGEGPEPKSQTTMEAKMTNDAIAYIRGLAELRGRNVDWAEEAVRDASSLPSRDALDKGVIEFLAVDLDDLIAQMNGLEVKINQQSYTISTEGLILQVKNPGWRTNFLRVITNPNLVLILGMIGFYGLILEFYNPGFGVPGVVGALCLLLAAFAMQLLPISYSGLAFILLGLSLMIAEAMVPSFGILGFGGIVAMVIGSVILIDTDVDAFQIAWPVIVASSLTSAALILVTLGLSLRIRKRANVSGIETMIGMRAIATAGFEVEGMVKVQGELWRAVCDKPVNPGDAVRITAINGLLMNVAKEDEQ